MLTPVEDVAPAFTAAVVEAFGARRGPRFTLVLSGGQVARGCYEALAATPGIDWDLVDVYLGDERFVPHGHEDANVRMIRQVLLDRTEPVGSFTPMPTGGVPDECAAHYQRVVADLVTGPGIDLIHMGMGPDGHTASLFPGAASHAPAVAALGRGEDLPAARVQAQETVWLVDSGARGEGP